VSAAGEIQRQFDETWRSGVDALLTRQGAAAAALAVDEGLGDERAAHAAREHVRSWQPVRLHLKNELKLWLRDGGPVRSVAYAKAIQKGNWQPMYD
jgi:hypothetical protein